LPYSTPAPTSVPAHRPASATGIRSGASRVPERIAPTSQAAPEKASVIVSGAVMQNALSCTHTSELRRM
jgi:hypothetical protein